MERLAEMPLAFRPEHVGELCGADSDRRMGEVGPSSRTAEHGCRRQKALANGQPSPPFEHVDFARVREPSDHSGAVIVGERTRIDDAPNPLERRTVAMYGSFTAAMCGSFGPVDRLARSRWKRTGEDDDADILGCLLACRRGKSDRGRLGRQARTLERRSSGWR